MELQNGYKVVYEVAADGKRTFYAADSNIYPNRNDAGEITDTKLSDVFTDTDYAGKLIYEYKGKFYVSTNGNIPSYDENGEPTDALLFNEDKFNEVFVKNVEEPAPAAISEGDETSTPVADGDDSNGEPKDDDLNGDDNTEDPEAEE